MGCDDLRACITLRDIAFTTGATKAAPPGAQTATSGGGGGQGGANVTLTYTINIASYSVFQAQVVVDRIMALLLKLKTSDDTAAKATAGAAVLAVSGSLAAPAQV